MSFVNVREADVSAAIKPATASWAEGTGSQHLQQLALYGFRRQETPSANSVRML